MGELSPWHWAIIAVVVLVLFGSKKLPDAARSIGRSLRIFKTELSALHDDEKPPLPPADVAGRQSSADAGSSAEPKPESGAQVATPRS